MYKVLLETLETERAMKLSEYIGIQYYATDLSIMSNKITELYTHYPRFG